MTENAAVRSTAPAPPPQPPPGLDFVRRHPVLAAFGALAGISLFAAYWPASAIVTGAIVLGRASGADRVAWRALRRGASAAAHRIGGWGRREPSPGVPTPDAPVPEAPSPSSPPPAAPAPPVPGVGASGAPVAGAPPPPPRRRRALPRR
ncbi:MAG: hypothetical protein ACREN2_07135, partial [Candidatus Dormibacteria bacterium]